MFIAASMSYCPVSLGVPPLGASLPRCLYRGDSLSLVASLSCGLVRPSSTSPSLPHGARFSGYFSDTALLTGYSSSVSQLSLEAAPSPVVLCRSFTCLDYLGFSAVYPCSNAPDLNVSHCRASVDVLGPISERSFVSFSYLKENIIQQASLIPWLLCCGSCVARPAFVLVGCSSENYFSVGFNGSSKGCFFTSLSIANSRIVLFALVADSIMCNKHLCVFIVVQSVSLIGSSVIMVRGLHDDVYCLSDRFALIYLSIYFYHMDCFAFVAASLITLKTFGLPPFVTFPSVEDV
ncbi:PREDICTED: uncharacterized protein LOC109126922 [Camelina sativa]|uniref:Uncharacterized protein LOC109126922 n=1 Tax=Camelina sativa TaxID=90675 RepID=A0ABM1QI21_CAMSA|nr:PREDICTED: uncharacterized protein LOC109126922 [Camelina sativa]